MSLRDALWLITALALAYAAWQLRGCTTEPETRTVTETDTTYLDRTITVRDTVTETRPVQRIVYRQQTDTVYVSLPVPTGFRVRGLVGASPIDIDGRRVTLTRWDPNALRWTQDVYRVPRKDWRLWPEIGAERTVWGYQAAARIGLRYRRVSGYVGYAWGPDRSGRVSSSVTFGIYLRPFTARF